MIRKSTAIVLGFFIILLAGTLFWQRTRQSTEDAGATATSVSDRLIDFEEVSIKSLTLQDNENQRVKIVRADDDKWKLLFPIAEATDEAAVSAAISQLLAVNINSIPQSIPNLEAVGLAPPAFTILIELKDGKQYLVNVGKQTPTESGYYVLTPDRTIYIVSKFNLESFLKLLEAPPILLTPTPPPTPQGSPVPDSLNSTLATLPVPAATVTP